jgi:hypothetical protein
MEEFYFHPGVIAGGKHSLENKFSQQYSMENKF